MCLVVLLGKEVRTAHVRNAPMTKAGELLAAGMADTVKKKYIPLAEAQVHKDRS